MANLKYLERKRLAGTNIELAQGVRAGPWLFFTGHEATDFQNGLVPPVAGNPDLPLGGAPRHLREGNHIISRFRQMIEAEGGDMRHIVRVDQYYPSAASVNGYQRARKAVLGNFVPPSTSVLMNELMVEGAGMNISWLAVLPGEGREPQVKRPEGVPVPPHSGFAASLVSGDYVFVAGQMANNAEMNAIEPAAYRAPNAIWNGTDIRLQTEFMITSRLKPALEAGGSSLKNAIKAQVYLTNIEDLPEFMDVWNSHFGDSPCALTVVETKGLALVEAIIEINILGLRDDAATKKEIIKHEASKAMRHGAAAVRAGDLLCLSGLYAADANGALPEVRAAAGLKHMGAPVRLQMNAILNAADEICRAGGTSLDKVVRANHFLGNMNVLHPMLSAWNEKLPGTPLPVSAVGCRKMPIPGCDIVMDMWAYRP